MAVVYKHIRRDTNEVFYIGIGVREYRAYTNHGRSGWWKKVVNKTEYDVEIIERNISYEEAKEKEKYWIKYYGRKNINTGCLINMTDGGDGTLGYKPTREAIEKSRQANIGRKASKEAREKMSKSGKGRKFTKEHKQKISIAHKGKIVSLETRQKLSKSTKEWYTTLPKSPVAKSIIQLSKDGVIIKTWESLQDAADSLGKWSSGISLCLTGKTKSAYGYIWRYNT